MIRTVKMKHLLQDIALGKEDSQFIPQRCLNWLTLRQSSVALYISICPLQVTHIQYLAGDTHNFKVSLDKSVSSIQGQSII